MQPITTFAPARNAALQSELAEKVESRLRRIEKSSINTFITQNPSWPDPMVIPAILGLAAYCAAVTSLQPNSNIAGRKLSENWNKVQ